MLISLSGKIEIAVDRRFSNYASNGEMAHSILKIGRKSTNTSPRNLRLSSEIEDFLLYMSQDLLSGVAFDTPTQGDLSGPAL